MKNWQEWGILFLVIVLASVVADYFTMKIQEKQLEKLLTDTTGKTE